MDSRKNRELTSKDILNTKPLKIADSLTKQEREALKNLTERNDKVIKPTDKGKNVATAPVSVLQVSTTGVPVMDN